VFIAPQATREQRTCRLLSPATKKHGCNALSIFQTCRRDLYTKTVPLCIIILRFQATIRSDAAVFSRQQTLTTRRATSSLDKGCLQQSDSGNVRTSTANEGGHQIPVAGIIGDDTTRLDLQGACQRVARISDPHKTLDWGCVAHWIDRGIPLAVIVNAIDAQVRHYLSPSWPPEDRYGARGPLLSLKFFHGRVLDTAAREGY
jgi:hypothetical protein